jgi:hypothetical protein
MSTHGKNSRSNSGIYFTARQLAQRYQISSRQVYRLGIKQTRFGAKTIRFLKEHVDEAEETRHTSD